MIKSISILITLLFSMSVYSQSLIGAWEGTNTLEDGTPTKNVVIFADGYQAGLVRILTYNEAQNIWGKLGDDLLGEENGNEWGVC